MREDHFFHDQVVHRRVYPGERLITDYSESLTFIPFHTVTVRFHHAKCDLLEPVLQSKTDRVLQKKFSGPFPLILSEDIK